MNIYDTANNLAKEIQQSDEYKSFAIIKKEISNNEDKKKKLEEFEKQRYLNQLEAMQGKTKDDSAINELKDQYAKLISDDEIRKYFEMEMKFNIMMADINKIIADAVKEIM